MISSNALTADWTFGRSTGFMETSPLSKIWVTWKVDVEFKEWFTYQVKKPFLENGMKPTWHRCNQTVIAEWNPGILSTVILGDASRLPIEKPLSVIFFISEKKHGWRSIIEAVKIKWTRSEWSHCQPPSCQGLIPWKAKAN